MATRELIENVKKYPHIKSNKKLDVLFLELSEFNFEDFFYFEYPFTEKYFKADKYLDEIDKELYDNDLDKKSEEYIEFTISVFKSAFPYFEKGILDIDLVSFLIFLRVNFFLEIDINDLIENYCYKSHFDSLLWNLSFELEKINISTMDLDSYNRSDEVIKKLKLDLAKDNMETLNSTFKFINLQKIVDLTKPPKLIFSRLLLELVSFLKQQNLNLFIRTMLNLDNLLAIILFVKISSFEEIENIYNNNEIKSEGLLFCFLKKIFDEKYEDVKKFNYLVKDILLQLFNSNKRLFRSIILLFHDKLILNESLGLFICDLDSKYIKQIVNELPIKWFSQTNDYRRKILESCNQDSKNYPLLLKLLFEKRYDYLNDKLQDDSEYFNLGNTLTDLCNCDLVYYLKFYNDNQIIEKIISILNSLRFLDSEWFYNYTDYKKHFHVYYADLLILSHIYNYKNLKSNDVQNLFEQHITIDFLKKLLYKEDIESIKIIKENLIN